VNLFFGDLYDYDKAQLLTNKVKDTLVSLYEFYLKVEKNALKFRDDVEVF
jgi:hypothetical protein